MRIEKKNSLKMIEVMNILQIYCDTFFVMTWNVHVISFSVWSWTWITCLDTGASITPPWTGMKQPTTWRWVKYQRRGDSPTTAPPYKNWSLRIATSPCPSKDFRLAQIPTLELRETPYVQLFIAYNAFVGNVYILLWTIYFPVNVY